MLGVCSTFGLGVLLHFFKSGFLKSGFGHDPRRNIHRVQLLEQQLARIRNFHIREIGSVVAHLAVMDMHLVVVSCNVPTFVADMHRILVG